MELHTLEFREALTKLDIPKLRRMWRVTNPHLPQPKNHEEALTIAHHARTQADSVPVRLRCYSHCWLTERGFPSGLPQLMRKRAEQMFPRIADAVGIALGGTSEIAQAIKPHVMGAMTDTVEDCYANGDRDPAIVKPRILAAKARITRQLLGTVDIRSIARGRV